SGFFFDHSTWITYPQVKGGDVKKRTGLSPTLSTGRAHTARRVCTSRPQQCPQVLLRRLRRARRMSYPPVRQASWTGASSALRGAAGAHGSDETGWFRERDRARVARAGVRTDAAARRRRGTVGARRHAAVAQRHSRSGGGAQV